MKIWKEFCSTILLLIGTASSIASDVFLKTDVSVGQGFLFERNKKCYIGTAAHVVEDAQKIEFLTPDRKYHPARIKKVFEEDFAILEVKEYKACLYKQPEAKTRLNSLLKVYRDGVLKNRLDDGSTFQTKITIIGIDDTDFLQIRPKDNDDILKQGYSGSILYIADQPAGMLLEVDDENVGYVYRQDAISKTLSNYFKGGENKKSVSLISVLRLFQKDEIKDKIFENKTRKYMYSWEKNTPVIFSQKKSSNKFIYSIKIINPKGELKYDKQYLSDQDYKFAFTPVTAGIYTIKVVGVKNKGKFKIKVKQDSIELKSLGKGNDIKVGDSLEGKIAANSIAEYKFSGQENSPIELIQDKSNNNFRYELSILNSEDESQYKKIYDARHEYKIGFTPTATGVYTVKLVGISNFGRYKIKFNQIALDSELRGAGNVVEAGDSLEGKIATNSIAEYKFSGQENSPIELIQDKSNNNFRYELSILNSEDESQYKKIYDARNAYKIGFTPTATGVYTVRLVGISNFGRYKIKFTQLALDSELRGLGNQVEVGDSLEGKLAVNSIAEFKLLGEKNIPIKLIQEKSKNNFQYELSILNSEGKSQYKKKYNARTAYKINFLPTATGMYTIRLVGITKYGKFKIRVK